MEEKIITNGEQLELNAQGAAAQIDEGVEVKTSSPFGKFKNANDLLDAYNNLQSEFTRKCQRLSELESSVSDKEVSPQYTSDSWQMQIDGFLEAHPDAKQYAKEIADVLYSDKTLASNPSSLELAYSRILSQKYKSPEELVEDGDFLDKYIYSNSKVTKKILDDYLQNYSKTPHLISSNVGASVNLTPNAKARNLAEARKLAEQLFK